jgi:hypothetical protein
MEFAVRKYGKVLVFESDSKKSEFAYTEKLRDKIRGMLVTIRLRNVSYLKNKD